MSTTAESKQNLFEYFVLKLRLNILIKWNSSPDKKNLVGGYKLGKVIIEGKTKVVYDLPLNAGLCLLQNKDKITAGDGVKKHDMAGKAAISNATNAKVFSILNAAGMRTAYVTQASPTAFISRKCEMIPIEWVTRRLATGSYCKRYPSVKEGYRYANFFFNLFKSIIF